VHKLVELRPERALRGPPVKIAIIDTGIELPSEASNLYGDQIVEFRSWLQCSGKDDLELRKGNKDLDGHGTHCVSVLLKVAQNAHIYVARAFKSRAERDMRHTSTTEAIIKVHTQYPLVLGLFPAKIFLSRHSLALSTNGR